MDRPVDLPSVKKILSVEKGKVEERSMSAEGKACDSHALVDTRAEACEPSGDNYCAAVRESSLSSTEHVRRSVDAPSQGPLNGTREGTTQQVEEGLQQVHKSTREDTERDNGGSGLERGPCLQPARTHPTFLRP